MAIYTRFGTPVDFVSARFIPVWIEQKPGRIAWHYRKPEKIGKKSTIEETPIMFVQAVDASVGPYGDPLCDGKWLHVGEFRADDGVKEIDARVLEIYPDANADFAKWNVAGGPDASTLFTPVDKGLIA